MHRHANGVKRRLQLEVRRVEPADLNGRLVIARLGVWRRRPRIQAHDETGSFCHGAVLALPQSKTLGRRRLSQRNHRLLWTRQGHGRPAFLHGKRRPQVGHGSEDVGSPIVVLAVHRQHRVFGARENVHFKSGFEHASFPAMAANTRPTMPRLGSKPQGHRYIWDAML